jgi:hypothetical protein
MGVRRFRQFLAEPTLSKDSNGNGSSTAKANLEIVIRVSIPQDFQNSQVIKLLKSLVAELSQAQPSKVNNTTQSIQ